MAHPNAGRKHSPEHIAKRVAAVAKAKASWTPERRAEISKIYSESNPMRNNEAARAKMGASLRGNTPWNKGNRWQDKLTPEQVRATLNEQGRRRRMKPKALVHGRVSALVRWTLKRVGSSKARINWQALLGYSQEELEAHLLTTIQKGYCWQDYISGALHLDHIVPVAAHNYRSADDIDFKRCWALSNLRLIPKEENYLKRAKLFKPFQPALCISAPLPI